MRDLIMGAVLMILAVGCINLMLDFKEFKNKSNHQIIKAQMVEDV